MKKKNRKKVLLKEPLIVKQEVKNGYLYTEYDNGMIKGEPKLHD